jgi:spoIIIJ-associated protein
MDDSQTVSENNIELAESSDLNMLVSEDAEQSEASETVSELMESDDYEETDPSDTESLRSTEKDHHYVNYQELDLSEEDLDEIADTAIDVIRELLYFFNAEESGIEEYEGEENELIFDIVGENLAMLIGRHGRTLEALQYLVSAIVSKRIGYQYPVVVDVEGYVNRRKQKLISLAKSSAARVIRQKRSVRLRPMSPYERRVVHMALKDDNRVKTESEGSDPNRQVVIYLA